MTTTACPFRSNPRMIANRNRRMMSLFGRLKPGTPLELCRARPGGCRADHLQQDYPKFYPETMGYGSTPPRCATI